MSQFPAQPTPGEGEDRRSESGATSQGSGSDKGYVVNETTLVTGAAAPGQASAVDESITVRPLSVEENAAVASLPQGSALLIMQPGPGSGARFLLDSDRTTAGRSERADILLDDVTVSRKHAQFVREDGEFLVRDSGSLNGTYVNRERVDTFRLRTGDEVQIGKYRMTFHPSPVSVQPERSGA